MKHVIILSMLIFLFCGMLVSCYIDEDTVDPCQETPNCIPELSDWKLHYTPHNSDCTTCHTTCTPSVAHTFCLNGELWTVTEDTCRGCHASQHL